MKDYILIFLVPLLLFSVLEGAFSQNDNPVDLSKSNTNTASISTTATDGDDKNLRSHGLRQRKNGNLIFNRRRRSENEGSSSEEEFKPFYSSEGESEEEKSFYSTSTSGSVSRSSSSSSGTPINPFEIMPSESSIRNDPYLESSLFDPSTSQTQSSSTSYSNTDATTSQSSLYSSSTGSTSDSFSFPVVKSKTDYQRPWCPGQALASLIPLAMRPTYNWNLPGTCQQFANDFGGISVIVGEYGGPNFCTSTSSNLLYSNYTITRSLSINVPVYARVANEDGIDFATAAGPILYPDGLVYYIAIAKESSKLPQICNLS